MTMQEINVLCGKIKDTCKAPGPFFYAPDEAGYRECAFRREAVGSGVRLHHGSAVAPMVINPKLDAIVAAIKLSGKNASAFFTVKNAEGTRLCHIDGDSIRVTDNEFYAVLKALQMPADPETQARWKLQRRAIRD